MSPWIKPETVRRRVPAGRSLPERFDMLVRDDLPFGLEWNNLKYYDLKASANKEALPFLRMGDGGLVALWWHAADAEPAVVYIGAHGEWTVAAKDFKHFLKGIGCRRSGVPDIDESDDHYKVPGVRGQPERKSLPALQAKFDDWRKLHTALLESVTTTETQALRKRVVAIAAKMIHDGCSKVYTAKHDWWSKDFRIEKHGDSLTITYLDYGEWHPLPAKYKLAPLVMELLTLVKHKRRKRYEMTVLKLGIVSIDRDRELVLVPPEDATG